jgi:hypothetical protein
MSYEQLEAELNEIDDRLDAIQQERKREWEAFADDPSLSLPNEVDVGRLQKRRNHIVEAMDRLEVVS